MFNTADSCILHCKYNCYSKPEDQYHSFDQLSAASPDLLVEHNQDLVIWLTPYSIHLLETADQVPGDTLPILPSAY